MDRDKCAAPSAPGLDPVVLHHGEYLIVLAGPLPTRRRSMRVLVGQLIRAGILKLRSFSRNSRLSMAHSKRRASRVVRSIRSSWTINPIPLSPAH